MSRLPGLARSPIRAFIEAVISVERDNGRISEHARFVFADYCRSFAKVLLGTSQKRPAYFVREPTLRARDRPNGSRKRHHCQLASQPAALAAKAERKLRQLAHRFQAWRRHASPVCQRRSSKLFVSKVAVIVGERERQEGKVPLEPEDSFDFLFKIVLIGDMGVGKTCVVQRFKNGTYIERQGTTIGVDFTMKTLIIDGKRVKLQIWDTGGQERFRTITQSYYRSANGIIICYDVTSEQSLVSVRRWLEDVEKFAAPNVIKLLIATKADLVDEREVSTEDGLKLAEAEQMNLIETSAKENLNIEQAFTSLAHELKERYAAGSPLEDYGTDRVYLNSRSMPVRGRLLPCCF
uniref:Ras-related protein Rab-43 n=1 Tax=Trichuris muris TaxID=70415 RepID=A0A5S6R5D3_TRIMR